MNALLPLKKKKIALIVVCMLSAIGTAPSAIAAETIELGEIVVTAPNQEALALTSQEVTQEDMRLYNRETVGEALNLLPGTSLSTGGPRNEQTITIRGFDLRQVPVFVDGVPIYVPYDGYVDLGRFNTFDLSQIQVSKGFSSVLYGPNALGGAVNLISRKPQSEFEGNATVGMYLDRKASYNGSHADVNLGGNQQTWYWQVSGSYLDKNQFRLPTSFDATRWEDGGKRDNSAIQDQKISIKVGITPKAGDEYAIHYINQQGTKENPVYAGDDLATTNAARFWQWPKWDKESLYLITRTGIGEDSYIKVRAYYDKFKNVLKSYDDTTYTRISRPFAFTSIYDDYSYGLSSEVGTDIGKNNTLKAAVHIKYDVHREHSVGFPVQTFEDRTTSIGLEDVHKINDQHSIVAGVSYDKRKTLEAEGLNGTRIFDFNRGKADAWNPQIGWIYKPSATDEVHATVSRKSRFATIKDRFSGRFGRVIPNPNLSTEESTNYELGSSILATKDLKLQGAVFYYDTKDLIQQVSLPTTACSSPPCGQFQNIGKVITHGVELGFNYFPADTLEVGASYTLLERDNKSNNLRLTDVPRHKLFGYTRWQLNGALAIVANIDANSGRNSSTDGLRTTDGFALANIKAMYQIDNAWSAEFGINNLLDKEYAYIEGYPAEGRNMLVNVTKQF